MSRCPQCGSKECCGSDMDEELTTANARIAELESALIAKTLNKVDVCTQLDAADKRIAELEGELARLREPAFSGMKNF